MYICLYIGFIPIDGIPNTDIVAAITLPISVVFIILNMGGLVFAIICFLFNIVHRNKK